MKGQERHYRHRITSEKLVSFHVVVKETDLHIRARTPLVELARELVVEHRTYLEAYIERNPSFAETRTPWQDKAPIPRIVSEMIRAGESAGVGPMAAVAGAIAEQVGHGLLEHSDEVIVENGGDIYLKLDSSPTIGIYAGDSPLSMRIGMRLGQRATPFAVCTSSGSVGHSFSHGRADAVCVIAESCALADAAATSIGNHVHKQSDINPAIEFGKTIPYLQGVLIVKDDMVGAWGDLEIVPIAKE